MVEKIVPFNQRKKKAKELLDEFRIDLITEVDTPKEIEQKATKAFKVPIDVDESPEYLQFHKEFKEKNIGKYQFYDNYADAEIKAFKQKFPELEGMRETQLKHYFKAVNSLKNNYRNKLKRMSMKDRKPILDKHEIHIQDDISGWGGEKGNFGLTVDSTYYEIMNEEQTIPSSWLKRVEKLQNQLNEEGCFIHMLGHPSAHEVVCLNDQELAKQKEINKKQKELHQFANKNMKEYQKAEELHDTKMIEQKRKEYKRLADELEALDKQNPTKKYLNKRYEPFGEYTSYDD